MSYFVNRIGSFIQNNRFVHEIGTNKYSKVALGGLGGLGVAAIAFFSWKVVVATGLAYSAYRGGQIVWNRFSRKVEKGPVLGAEVIENPLAAPLQEGDHAHGDQQEHNQDEVPFVQEETEGERRDRIIAELRTKKVEMMQDPNAKNPGKIGLVFDAIIYHSSVYEKGGNAQWQRQKILKYAKRSNAALNCMIAYRKMKWALKSKFDCVIQKP